MPLLRHLLPVLCLALGIHRATNLPHHWRELPLIPCSLMQEVGRHRRLSSCTLADLLLLLLCTEFAVVIDCSMQLQTATLRTRVRTKKNVKVCGSYYSLLLTSSSITTASLFRAFATLPERLSVGRAHRARAQRGCDSQFAKQCQSRKRRHLETLRFASQLVSTSLKSQP